MSTSALGTPDDVKEQLDRFRADFESLRREVGKVIVGHGRNRR